MSCREADIRDESYGPFDRNIFDLWLVRSEGFAPLLVYFHGGGFMAGDKKMVLSAIPVSDLLDAGISVASANYRLSVTAPYPAQMYDAARAIQFIRCHAGKWNMDPGRVAVAGSSAGGGISLWLAFHRDMAKQDAEDPVNRCSTRVTCAIGLRTQCSYDPREIRKIVPGMAYNNDCIKLFFGVPLDTNWDTYPVDAELDVRMKDASPLTHITADAPAVYLFYQANQEEDGNIHHANFGRHLERAMKNLGVECVRRFDREYVSLGTTFQKECVEFLLRQFSMDGTDSKRDRHPSSILAN